MLDQTEIECPYCGAAFTALIDPDDGDTDYIQDCEVCCQPILFRLRVGIDGQRRVEVARDD